MAAEKLIQLAPEDITQILTSLGSIGKWLQAIGIIAVIWIVFQIANWYINRKRIKKLKGFQESLERIEKKLDKLSKKGKN